ncbi:copper chaperone PCu(A)C [Streptomyces aidingensis]|uniref:Copper(I)-binding protein n=1 Tax=Streptomyces aidingensis TaxID=910347 RepID=A0A1I1QL49_9ACTN|nr:copper chaperone PCu(A)C [Streptomyces aidingensis]SFD20568.1 hypothetical protein SAMN05421773_11163 [Streptomyces aidingensis]
MRRRGWAGPAALLLALAPTAAACADGDGDGGGGGGGPELTVADAFVPQPVNDDLAAGFLTVRNTGDADDALVSATTPAAASVELHRTVDNAMRQVDSLPVPAGGTLELRRGGDHLMLVDLSTTLTEGDTVTLELRFRTSDPLTVEVPVESATHTGQDTGQDTGHGDH